MTASNRRRSQSVGVAEQFDEATHRFGPQSGSRVVNKLLEQRRPSFVASSTMSQRVFDLHAVGLAAVVKEDLDRIGDRPLHRVEVVARVPRFFDNLHPVVLHAVQTTPSIPLHLDWLPPSATGATHDQRVDSLSAAALERAVTDLTTGFGTGDQSKWLDPVHTTTYMSESAADLPPRCRLDPVCWRTRLPSSAPMGRSR